STRLYFQPNANYNGTVASAVTFRAWDQSSGSNGALANTSVNGGTTAFSTALDTASITVTAVNDAPVAAADAATVAEGASVVVNLAANDSDVDNALDLASIQIVAGPANGSVVVNGDGTVSYTHNGSETTSDSFTYTIRDAAGAVSNVATV